MDNKTYELISESFYNTYYSMGAVLAEALGLINEKRKDHKVGEVKRNQPFGRKGDYVYTPGSRGKPGTGEGGRPATRVKADKEHRRDSSDIEEVPGAHSTGGTERGVKKKEKQPKDKAEADANNAAFRAGSRMK